MSPFTPGSSPVDWCEENYIINSSIAEFSNTISNVLFVIIPFISLRLFYNYGKYIGKGILVVWILFIVVGISSAYFHSTLSLIGQLLDELSILWVIATGFGLWLPRRLLPLCFHGSRKLFQDCMLGSAALTTLFSWVFPSMNAFALMFLLVPSCSVLSGELKRCKNTRVIRLGYQCAFTLSTALFCWLVDRLGCKLCLNWGLPNMHALWHVFICLGAHMGCVLFAYFEAVNEAPEQSPTLRFWPNNNYDIGISYVFLETGHKVNTVGHI